MKRSFAYLVAIVGLAGLVAGASACGDDDGGNGGGGGSAVDAAPGSALGVRCGPGLSDCPDDHTCVVRNLPDGSDSQGYCSPACTDDIDCTAGYTGPGDPVCFSANECVIVCTDAQLCPTGLTCLATGGPTDVCGVPADG